VIREIAWRLREIGNDGRICDLIDSQVSVIEAGAQEISSEEAKAALRAAFASIAARLAEFGDDAPAPVAEVAVAGTAAAEAAVSEAPIFEAPIASPAPAAAEVAPVAVAETIEAAAVQEAPKTATISPEAEVALADADAKAALEEAEAAELAAVTDEAADAHDEAMLDLIAQEMGAADEFDLDEPDMVMDGEAHMTELPPAESGIAAEVPDPVFVEEPEPVAETAEPTIAMLAQAILETSPPTAAESAPEPAPEVSLGSSLLASGIVRKPMVAANDPLAPIRRMSQVEKIAFFS
jgi:hypothetical protein